MGAKDNYDEAEIAERKRAEAALHHRERELEIVVNKTPFLLTRCSRDLRYQFVSRAYAEMVGCDPVEISGQLIVDIIGEKGFNAIQPYIERVLKGERVVYESEVHFKHKGRGYLYVTYVPDRDETGNVIGWIASMLDVSERRRQEEEVERLAKLIELSFEPVMVWDFDNGIVTWNAGAEQLYGYTRGEALGQRTDKLLRTMRSIPLPEFRELLQRDGTWIGELRHITKDGHEIIADSRHQLLEVGGRRLVLETIRDITARRRAEEALRESEERFRQFAENSGDVFWIIDAQNYRMEYLNPAYEKIFGEPREPIMRNLGRWAELIHPEDREEGADMLPRLVAGEKLTIEYRIIRPSDKEVRWIRDAGFPIPDVLGRIGRVGGVLQDITEEKARADALSESEERFRYLVEGARDYAIFMLDPSNRIVHWNPGAERIFGWTAEEAIGKSGRLIFTPEDKKNKQEEKEIAIARRDGVAPDKRWHIRKNGTRIWVDGVMRRIDDEKTGAFRGFAKVARDATEMHRAQEELERRVIERTAELTTINDRLLAEINERSRLEQEILLISEREKRQIGQELHDSLCQELAASAFLLKSEAEKTGKKQPRMTQALLEAAQVVNANVGLARDLARGLHPVELGAAGLVNALRELAYRVTQTAKVECRFVCPRRVPIHDDAIVLNLYRIAQEAVNNAVRHAKPRTITISLRRTRLALVLQIADDGEGISKKVPHKGMGLEIMRHRSNAIGGEFVIESNRGFGTTVTCTLRIA